MMHFVKLQLWWRLGLVKASIKSQTSQTFLLNNVRDIHLQLAVVDRVEFQFESGQSFLEANFVVDVEISLVATINFVRCVANDERYVGWNASDTSIAGFGKQDLSSSDDPWCDWN